MDVWNVHGRRRLGKKPHFRNRKMGTEVKHELDKIKYERSYLLL